MLPLGPLEGRDTMHRFYIAPEQVEMEMPVIEGSDARHIHTVLRLKPGDSIAVFDGLGNEFPARIVTVERRRIGVELSDKVVPGTESPLRIALAQSYLKDKKMDQLVRQVMELGVNHFIPFMAHRSVPRPDQSRSRARHQRWEKITMEALKQCRRSRPMDVEPLLSFEAALALSRPHDRPGRRFRGAGAKYGPRTRLSHGADGAAHFAGRNRRHRRLYPGTISIWRYGTKFS
jgi:16S rRNA (uracil1498-N3)-methyltransferase